MLVVAAAVTAGCGSNDVNSKDDAKRAYLGLDGSIDRAIDLGFAGFNAANSANIPAEMAAGAMAGTLTVTGQVDQGVSANKQMRLNVAMAGYRDVSGFTYDTDINDDGGVTLPALDMSLQGIPTGTLSGTLVGTFRMSLENCARKWLFVVRYLTSAHDWSTCFAPRGMPMIVPLM